jgi:hypothetical protein
MPKPAMGAPPPEGSSPWHQDVPVVGPPAGLPRDAWMGNEEPRSPSRRRTGLGPERVTPWLWLPVGLSATLLVLFAVVVNRQQAQALRIGELSSRVRALEQSRALERTAVLEQQLRAMLTRMQTMEKGGLELISKERDQHQVIERLQSEVEQMRNALLTQGGDAADGLPPPSSPAASGGRRPALTRPAIP